MKKLLLLGLLLVVLIPNSFGQKKEANHYIGIGMMFGSKSIYNQGGVFIYSRLFNHIDLDFGFTKGNYNGNGYSGGINFVPLKTKIQPFIGIQYSKHFGNSVFNVISNGNSTNFKINQVEFFHLKTGLMGHLHQNEDGKRHTLINLTLSYRKTPYSEFRAYYIDGFLPYQDEEKLNSRIGDGLGISISIVLLLANR